MVIYSKDLADMIKEAMLDLGGVRTIPEVSSWIRDHYPDDRVKESSISTSMSDLSINGPPSSLYAESKKFLYRVDRGRYQIRTSDQRGLPPFARRIASAESRYSHARSSNTSRENVDLDVADLQDIAVVSDSTTVEVWSKEVLQFEPLKSKNPVYQTALKCKLIEAIRGLDPSAGRTLYASYSAAASLGLTQRQGDIENILFYNLGMTPFSKFSENALVFERSFEAPSEKYSSHGSTLPAAAVSRGHRYYYALREDAPRIWKRESALATFTTLSNEATSEYHEFTPFIAASSDNRKPDHFWYAVKRGNAKVLENSFAPGDMLGIRIDLHLPLAGVSWVSNNLLKPLVDGIVSAFHAQAPDTETERAERITRIMERLSLIHPNSRRADMESEVASFLYDNAEAILGRVNLVTFLHNRRSIQWNPADDRIVAAEITVSSGARIPFFSGELFKVKPLT